MRLLDRMSPATFRALAISLWILAALALVVAIARWT